MAKSKSSALTTASAPGVLVPAVTAFDFLEGGFARSERSRLVGLVVAGLAAVNLAAGLAMGAVASVEVASQNGELVTAEEALARVSGELAVLDQAGGIPTSRIDSHIATREQALREAVGQELDTVRLLRDLWSGAPAGVDITKVTFAGEGTAPASGQGAAGEQVGTPVTVTATASGFALLAQWSTALAATPGLSEVDLTWTGGGEAVQVTVTATLTDQALSARARALSPASTDPGTGGQTTWFDTAGPGQGGQADPSTTQTTTGGGE